MAFTPKPEEPKKGAPEYMNTYGDLVTLLLTFFVLLFSMSSVDVEKFKALAEALSGEPTVLAGGTSSVMPDSGEGLLPDNAAQQEQETEDPGTETHPWSVSSEEIAALEESNVRDQELNQMASEFKTYFAQNTATEGIQVQPEDTYLRLTFPGSMLFESGEAYLDDAAREAIDLVSAELQKYPDYSITVEGHTDDIPMSSTSIYPSNRHLSSARADTVVEYLIQQHGFDPMHTNSLGMGEYWPLVANDSAENRAINRRVEILMEKIVEADENSGSNFFGG